MQGCRDLLCDGCLQGWAPRPGPNPAPVPTGTPAETGPAVDGWIDAPPKGPASSGAVGSWRGGAAAIAGATPWAGGLGRSGPRIWIAGVWAMSAFPAARCAAGPRPVSVLASAVPEAGAPLAMPGRAVADLGGARRRPCPRRKLRPCRRAPSKTDQRRSCRPGSAAMLRGARRDLRLVWAPVQSAMRMTRSRDAPDRCARPPARSRFRPGRGLAGAPEPAAACRAAGRAGAARVWPIALPACPPVQTGPFQPAAWGGSQARGQGWRGHCRQPAGGEVPSPAPVEKASRRVPWAPAATRCWAASQRGWSPGRRPRPTPRLSPWRRAGLARSPLGRAPPRALARLHPAQAQRHARGLPECPQRGRWSAPAVSCGRRGPTPPARRPLRPVTCRHGRLVKRCRRPVVRRAPCPPQPPCRGPPYGTAGSCRASRPPSRVRHGGGPAQEQGRSARTGPKRCRVRRRVLDRSPRVLVLGAGWQFGARPRHPCRPCRPPVWGRGHKPARRMRFGPWMQRSAPPHGQTAGRRPPQRPRR
ncbi:hypothetical protein roselon_01308 [Roseibacterium elongatum DSM 19469]|uniref:Uncharacterized protein n=1 Tax=Roseicyclus elongatus DSM 19469 TaxID=1294273 RepID=W8S4H0_9RHOB|nr:hypothetical protein roselon_01308 [Roseibacterium elongatum DSM 19469]